jgi:hypothetical protein
VAAHILTSPGPAGCFSLKHANQLYSITGPELLTGGELARTISKALGIPMSFQGISEREAQALLKPQGDIDPSELQYLLEYYGLVREGKCNWKSTTAFEFITGVLPQDPEEFFTLYAESMSGPLKSEAIRRWVEEVEASRSPEEDTEPKEPKKRLKKRKVWPGEGHFALDDTTGEWIEMEF